MSRRDQIKMTGDEISAYLEGAKTVILCSNSRNGHPHPMPMWFTIAADGAIQMTTFAKSQKVNNLRKDPRCSLIVESGLEYQDLKGVVIEGRAEILEDQELIIDTLMVAANPGGSPPSDPEQLKALRAAMAGNASKRVLIRVLPERILSWDHGKLGGVY
jgi:general stress protein 26